MRLVDETDVLAAVDALDEPQLPQRTAAVEHLGHEPFGELEQLPARAGRRERGQSHVSSDVELVVVDPHRAPAPERHRHHPLAEARDQLQA